MPSDSDPGSVLQCATNKRHLGFTLTFLLVSFRLAVVWSPVHYQWNDTTVLFFSERGRNASEKQAKTDGSGPPVVWRTRIICKNLGLKDMLDCFFWFISSATIKKVFLSLLCKFLSLEMSTDLLQTESQKLSQALSQCSEPQKPKFKFSSLREVCDKSDSPVLHIKKPDTCQGMGAPWWWRVRWISGPACLGICNVK